MTRLLSLTFCAGLALAAPGVALAGEPGAGHRDPSGNNGTVKIGSVPLDKAPHANQPRVGCAFSLRFFGFDAGQTADITFTGQAPTKAGALLSQSDVRISDDAAGGGRDADAVLTYTAQQLGLGDVTPTQQGWHVKVGVDALQAPGGAKQKVFWLSCPSAAPAAAASTGQQVGGGGVADTRGKAVGQQRRAARQQNDTASAPVSAGAAQAAAGAFGGGSLSLPRAGTVTVSEQRARGPLPFTGSDIVTLLWLGAAAVSAGTALTVTARRPAT